MRTYKASIVLFYGVGQLLSLLTPLEALNPTKGQTSRI